MDTENLLKLLNDHGVEYVIIGAFAFPVHGYARATLDIDLAVRPERSNAERLHAALSEFGYDLTEIDIEDLLSKKLLIRQYVVAVDIHPFFAGGTFDEIWERRVSDFYGETPAFFAGLEDLIEMKRAADRPKDREDLRYLLEIRRREENGSRE